MREPRLGVGNGNSKKWSGVRYILKIELIALADGYFSVEVCRKLIQAQLLDF